MCLEGIVVPQEGFEPPTPSLRMSWNILPDDFLSFLEITKYL